MTDDLMTAFDDSLNALAAGESIGAIVARYPHLGTELRPMLEAAQAARQWGAAASVPAAAQSRSRAQFLTHAAALRAPRQPSRTLWGQAALKARALLAPANRALAVTVAFVLGFVMGTYGVLTASAQSLPGEPLYGLKRTVEQTQLLLSMDPRARGRLENDFSERRVDEVERLLAAARRAQVAFGGVLESLDGERWSVAGITVTVPGSAEISGTPFPGLYVAVDGLSQPDGTVVATRVQVTGRAFLGTVRALSAAAWQVDDTRLVVNEATIITGTPQPGDWVSVTARPLPDGSWLALQIVLQPGGVPAPLPTTPPVTDPTPQPDDSGSSGPSPTNTPRADEDSSGPGPAPSNTPEPDDAGGAVDDLDDDNEGTGGAAQEQRWEGTLEAINGSTWVIAGQSVTVSGATEIRDTPQIGDPVEVRALPQPDGTLLAVRIEKND